MTQDSITLKVSDIRRIFRRNRGAAAELAKELALDTSTISKWLHGKVDSARIAQAAQRKARELADQEAARAA